MFAIDRRLICRECFLSNVIARANTERRSLWISSRFGLNQTHATVSICRIFCNAAGTADQEISASERETVAPPGFCNRGEVRYGSIGDLEYAVPQSRLYCLCINVALCSTALQCICLVIRRSSMTMKAHTYYIIFGRPFIGGKLPPFPPWRRH